MADRFAYRREFNHYGAITQTPFGDADAQIFSMPSQDGVASTVYLFTKALYDVNVIVSLRAVDENNYPIPPNLASSTINILNGVLAGGDDGSHTVYKHTISLLTSLTADTNYAIVVIPDADMIFDTAWIKTFRNLGWKPEYDKDEGVVRSVGAKHSDNGGASWADSYWQLCFEVYGELAPISKTYPSNDLVRVTNIRHVYRPGSYRLEATLGGVSTSVELPQRDVRIPSVVPLPDPRTFEKFVRSEKAVPLRLPERTAPELIEALREEGLLPEAGASADITALEPLPIRPGILEQFKPISRADLEKLGTIIGQEAPPEPSLWQKLTPWKEERGETFGTAFTSTFRRGFEEVAKLGESYKKFFGGLFG